MVEKLTSQSALPDAFREKSRSILIALFFPTIAMILNGSMFGIALPTIRDEFGMSADMAAWLTIAFSLPFMMLMPLFGRLGDELGRANLLVTGLIIFSLGSFLAFQADALPMLFVGRLIQGAGASGLTPLTLAIIAQRFSAGERGKAMATWNATAPATSIFAPSIGGFMVDHLGWRAIFLPALLVAVLAVFITRWKVPTLRGKPNWAVLRTFDWGGTLLLAGLITFVVLFVSSRPVTGVDPFQDWRLLSGGLIFGFSFVRLERKHARPLIDLDILKVRDFRLASLAAAMRMSMMAGIGFLIPLYLKDNYGLSASGIGLLATTHSISLFLTIRKGGALADQYPNRWLVSIGMILQLLAMAYFAALPQGVPLTFIAAGIVVHGMSAGLSLGALHRTAMGSTDEAHSGSAAGFYSMTRFAGSMLAVALAGIILQNGLDRGLSVLHAYQLVFAFLALTGAVGVLLALRLQE